MGMGEDSTSWFTAALFDVMTKDYKGYIMMLVDSACGFICVKFEWK